MVILSNYHSDGSLMTAHFDPLRGMNLTSLRLKNQEILDQSTRSLFQQRNAGLGALIGPHFHHRSLDKIPKNFPQELFPHLLYQNKDQGEPFSHGIARYVPWKYEASSTQIKAWLNGSDLYQGLALKTFEGFNFSLHLDAILLHDGLLLDYSIDADLPCVIGFHYYYPSTPDSFVEGLVKPFCRDKNGWGGIKSSWFDQKNSKLHFSLDQEADFGFMPLHEQNSSSNLISLKTNKHHLLISYTSSNEEETSWQLYHPKEATYVCLEPLSALDPFKPVLKRNRLQMKISYY